MKIPRVRFSLRWLMVAVAVVALGVGCSVSYSRWKYASARVAYFAFWAESFEFQSRYARDIVASNKKLSADGRWEFTEIYLRQSDNWAAQAAYYRMMERKYRRAARYPFLPVAPDPPEPEQGEAPAEPGSQDLL